MKRKMPVTSEYAKTYTSFSGHDMVCVFELAYSPFKAIQKVVGSVQTISYSIHNEKMPVRVLGDMNPKNWIFGNRTIAGSIVFTVFDKHWIKNFVEEYRKNISSHANMLMDEMPPFNITISMANEYGDKARLALYGVTFVNEGQVMSIEDIYTENTYQFYAQDIDYLEPEHSSVSSKYKDKNAELRKTASMNNDSDPNFVKKSPNGISSKIDAPSKSQATENVEIKSTKEDIKSKLQKQIVYKEEKDNPASNYKKTNRNDYNNFLEASYKKNLQLLQKSLEEKKITKDEFNYLNEITKKARNDKRIKSNNYYNHKKK